MKGTVLAILFIVACVAIGYGVAILLQARIGR